MTVTYSTITSKGQITLPAALRRKLHMSTGTRVQIKEVDGKIVIDPPMDLDAIRTVARAEMEAAGTWGTIVTPDSGWVEHAAERYKNA